MVCAHMDEVGMMVRTIEKDGFLGITKVGGIDPRVLPAHEVVVHGREELFGVIGAKPPHVTTPAEREKMIPLEELMWIWACRLTVCANWCRWGM